MRRFLPWLAVAAAAALAAAATGAIAIGVSSERSAQAALDAQRRLLAAREDVARAQRALEGSNIEDALESAVEANRAAERVGRVTERIVSLLRPTARTARVVGESAENGLRSARFARRHMEVASRLLGAIAGYQEAASRSGRDTARALARILAAIRQTNDEFPGGT